MIEFFKHWHLVLFFGMSKKRQAQEDERIDHQLTAAYGPKGTDKRDEYEALISGRVPRKPLKYFSVSYRSGDKEIKIEPGEKQKELV